MNPIIANLIHQIAIKQTSQNLRHLKSTTNQNMKIPLILNKESQAKIASLESENARLKASAGTCIITNSAGDHVVAVTSKDPSGKLATRNLSMDEAAAHSKRMVAKFTSRPSKAPKATATSPAPSPATTPLPASKEVDFEPTPQLKPLSRSEFNSLTPADRTRFAVAGGHLK